MSDIFDSEEDSIYPSLLQIDNPEQIRILPKGLRLSFGMSDQVLMTNL